MNTATMNTTSATQQGDTTQPTSNLTTDTGTTGRPRRGRYSKAAMFEDIVSLADPRLWPVYVAGVLMALIPVYALFGAIEFFNAVVTARTAPDNADQTWRSPEEPVQATTLAGSDAMPVAPTVPTVPTAIATREERASMMAPGDQFSLMGSPAPATAATPLRSASAQPAHVAR